MDKKDIESSNNFPPQEDNFERLWTPHRMVYVQDDHSEVKSEGECPFCNMLKLSDEKGLIIHRGKLNFVIMNLYPYNSGHIMVCPKRHIGILEELNDDEFQEFNWLTRKAIKAVKTTLKPDGLNLGINQGRVAGAGVASHLHQHIIPRWLGDANFFPIVAQTRTIGTLLLEQRNKLSSWEGWEKD